MCARSCAIPRRALRNCMTKASKGLTLEVVPGKFMFLLVLWGALEIASLYFLGVFLGFWTVAYLGILTGFFGFSTLTRQGRALSQEYAEMAKDPARFAAQTQAQAGGMDAVKSRYADRMLGMLSGIMLIIPGALSDLAGLALQIPPLRRSFQNKASQLMESLPQNPKFQDFVARQGANMPGGMPGGFGGGMPGGFGGGMPGGFTPPNKSSSPRNSGPVIDTTFTDS